METVCIVGGGPAGMMLGLLLARAGVSVTVMEKHKDFFRDFRGDTIHPSTLEVLEELGLLDSFLKLPHSRVDGLSAVIGDETVPVSDFSGLPVKAPYIALMPQWDFLDFLKAEAERYPAFKLRMEWEVTGLLVRDGATTGVRVKTPEGEVEFPAQLTVGCDGRHAISRDAGHLALVEDGVPVDVLWFRIARQPTDPENALGYVNYGHFAVLINRNDYFQVGYLIRKGSYDALKSAGLAQFREGLERVVPFLAGRTGELDSWEKLKLLTIQVNHLKEWAYPGLLCIGDAAHAMSPVGGIGINIALQDAVATANRLMEGLKTGSVTVYDLAGVQHYRERAVRNTQRMQVAAHRVLNRVLGSEGKMRPPWLLRVVTRMPGFQGLVGRFIGMGLQPQHVRTWRAAA